VEGWTRARSNIDDGLSPGTPRATRRAGTHQRRATGLSTRTFETDGRFIRVLFRTVRRVEPFTELDTHCRRSASCSSRWGVLLEIVVGSAALTVLTGLL
jgi:hypothetical protein